MAVTDRITGVTVDAEVAGRLTESVMQLAVPGMSWNQCQSSNEKES